MNIKAWGSGLLGVIIFSGTLPATRVAVAVFDPLFFTLARAVIAGIIALLMLWLLRQSRPNWAELRGLLLVVLGVVLGFPLLSALALQQISAAHATVFAGLLPVFTVLFAVLRGDKNPAWPYWLFACVGSILVAGFALQQGLGNLQVGDGLMLLAVLLCGMGYAEGAQLARRIGGWQVICWALVLSLPLFLPALFWSWPTTEQNITWPAVIGLAYVSLFSMLLGFFCWYYGLASGGTAAISQLQLLQPFFALGLAGWLLGEQISTLMLLVAMSVALCVFGARRFAR